MIIMGLFLLVGGLLLFTHEFIMQFGVLCDGRNRNQWIDRVLLIISIIMIIVGSMMSGSAILQYLGIV